MPDLIIAEIPYDTGEVRLRYARYLSDDGTRWIRHGLFRSYHLNGNLASEGTYLDGAEEGEEENVGGIAEESIEDADDEVAEELAGGKEMDEARPDAAWLVWRRCHACAPVSEACQS